MPTTLQEWDAYIKRARTFGAAQERMEAARAAGVPFELMPTDDGWRIVSANKDRVAAGRAAIAAGDRDGNAAAGDAATGYVDALANIMHAADADGVDFDTVLASARSHHWAETAGESC